MRVTEIMCRQVCVLHSETDTCPETGGRYWVARLPNGGYGYFPCAIDTPPPPLSALLPAQPVDIDAEVDCQPAPQGAGWATMVVLQHSRPVGVVTPAEWLPVLAQKCRESTGRLRELEEWKLNMESAFEIGSAHLFTTDASGVVTQASPLAEQLYGHPREELIGRRVEDLQRDSVFYPSATQAAIKSRSRQVVVQHTASGRKLIVTATPVFGTDGQVERVVGLVRDITDSITFEQELHRNRQMTSALFEDLQHLLRQQRASSGIATNSPAMRRVLNLVEQVSEVDSSVLILGESGVGKEVVARRIHELSPRHTGNFVKVDCASLPENLIESELFGYERGAFTGAQRDGKIGLVELADNGTVFLDEIGEMPLSLQVKLLRVIQDREFYRVGGVKPVRVNVRFLSATNRELAEEVRLGRFRRDLYYRLNVVPLRIPPLRERREDIPGLVDLFLERFCKRYSRSRALSPQAMQILLAYSWPGNVRQLENVIERMTVTTENSVIQPQDLTEEILQPIYADGPAVSVQDLVPLKEAMETVERQLLRMARERFGTETRMAQALGVHQSTISRMLQRYYGSGNEEG